MFHERHEPDVFLHFLDPQRLPSEHLGDVDFLVVKAHPATGGDDDRPIEAGQCFGRPGRNFGPRGQEEDVLPTFAEPPAIHVPVCSRFQLQVGRISCMLG